MSETQEEAQAKTEDLPQQVYVNWAVSVQCRGSDASDAMDVAFEQGYPNPDEGTNASFETAKKSVIDFLSDEDGWWQINASGSHPHNEGERKHINLSINPVAAPHGV
jgi:hypothetical protein